MADVLATCRALTDAASPAMGLADRVYIIINGHIIGAMTADEARHRAEVLRRHLGV